MKVCPQLFLLILIKPLLKQLSFSHYNRKSVLSLETVLNPCGTDLGRPLDVEGTRRTIYTTFVADGCSLQTLDN